MPDVWCLASVWRLDVAYIGPKSRTERPRKTKFGTEVARVTRDSDTTFKVKGQGHQAALLTAALTRQAAVAVSVGTYWPWEPIATLRSAGAVGSAVRGASAPTEGGEGRGHILAAARLQLIIIITSHTSLQTGHVPSCKRVNEIGDVTCWRHLQLAVNLAIICSR